MGSDLDHARGAHAWRSRADRHDPRRIARRDSRDQPPADTLRGARGPNRAARQAFRGLELENAEHSKAEGMKTLADLGAHARSLGLAAAIGLSIAPLLARDAARPRAEVVFSDEFDGAELDRAKWGVIVTGRTVNNEQQAYVDSPQTIHLAHGAEAAGA